MPVAKCAMAKTCLQKIRERLSEKRVSHSVFTAEYLSSFAPDLGLDHDDAVVAGLLHDYCRDLDKEAFLLEARQRRMPLSDTQLAKPSLLHGPLSAEMCREEFDINDHVYEAIYWHTTGRPKLNRLGQALYVADFAEPTRTFEEASETRALLRKAGFDAALLFVAETKVRFNREKPVIDPNTEAFLIWLKTKP